MKYDYTVYTPVGAIRFAAATHNTDLVGKLTCLDDNYVPVAEFPVWHGFTRSPQPELVTGDTQAVPAPGDFTAGPIVFPELPEDDDFQF